MESIYLHILSDFNAVFKILDSNRNQLISVNSKESLSDTIDLEINNPAIDFEIAVYPIRNKEETFLPYSLKMKYTNNILISENNYAKVFTLPENHFLIKFLSLSIEKQSLSGDKLESNNSEIKKLSYLNDLAGRARVEILKVGEKNIVKENEYYVYTNSDIKAETFPDLILLAFFEAYKAKDYNTCFGYLSDTYRENLNKEGLIEFFGDFESCLLVNYYSNPSVILLYDKHSSVYSADIRESKIFDIYELN